jgi:hypothetical protein
VLLLGGCATAPPAPPATTANAPAVSAPPAAPPPAPPPPPAPAVPLSRLICTVQEARRVSFADLGVPAGSVPLDLALAKDRVWILFAPALLVGLPRTAEPLEPAAVAGFGGVEEVEMIPGPRPDAWRSVSADPLDGTLWLASPSGLWRRRPGRRPEMVAITEGTQAPAETAVKRPARKKSARKRATAPAAPPLPVPAGGFRAAVAGRGAVWAAPACADHAVWKLDSQGRRLAADLPVAAEPCAAADLERDWSGDLLAFLPATDTVFRLAFDGTWQPAGDVLDVPMPAPDGGRFRTWFFWGTEAVSLADSPGDSAGDPPDGILLLRRIDGRATAFHEDCGPGNTLLRVAGDARGWAALTRQWLLVGEHRRIDPPASH